MKSMKRFRWAHFALLLIYAGVLIGVQFHSHATGPDQLTAHCKSCHISQTVYDNVPTKELKSAEPTFYFCKPETETLIAQDLKQVRSSRAPPQV